MAGPEGHRKIWKLNNSLDGSEKTTESTAQFRNDQIRKRNLRNSKIHRVKKCSASLRLHDEREMKKIVNGGSYWRRTRGSDYVELSHWL